MLWKRTIFTSAFVILLFGVLGVIGPEALAQTNALEAVGETAGLPTTSLPLMIARLIRAALGVLGILLVCIVLYGGWLYMASQGDPKKVDTAKKVLQNAVIGVIIIFSSFSITQFVISRILGAGQGTNGGVAAIIAKYSEPLSGSLGAGVIETHYPPRNATDIPRNTMIMVTFKESMDPGSLIEGYADNPSSTALNADNVQIYRTAQLADGVDVSDIALPSSGVSVSASEDFTSFVFDPIELLGSAADDINYTVVLGSDIRTADNTKAFSGSYRDGYAWTFEVSTEVDLEPPTVVSVIPRADNTYDRNISVSITFSEAMNPIAATGTYDGVGELFGRIAVSDEGTVVPGAYAIGNNYRTVDFTPTEACGVDPCGDIIYCLPGNADLGVTAYAATLGGEPPQALLVGAAYDGLVDASGNSLDGDNDGAAEGSEADDYAWNFATTDDVCDEVPAIQSLSPGIREENADNSADVSVLFTLPMKTSTLTSSHIQLWPDPWYEFWFNVSSEDAEDEVEVCGDEVQPTMVSVDHPTLVSSEDAGWNYYPLITKDVKSAYQICMVPALGPASGRDVGSCDVSAEQPYCCNGSPSATACETGTGELLPPTSN